MDQIQLRHIDTMPDMPDMGSRFNRDRQQVMGFIDKNLAISYVFSFPRARQQVMGFRSKNPATRHACVSIQKRATTRHRYFKSRWLSDSVNGPNTTTPHREYARYARYGFSVQQSPTTSHGFH